MKDYADREYIHGRVHALMGTFPGRSEYAGMYNSSSISSAFSRTPGLYEEKNPDRIKENLFRENIRTLIELIDASSYYRQFLVSVLRIAEAHNVISLAARLDGTPVTDEWLDISPYNVLPAGIDRKDINIGEIVSALKGTSLERVFQPGDENSSSLVPERFFKAFINGSALSSRTLLPSDRQVIHRHLALVMGLVRMSEKSRHHEYYSTEDEPPEYEPLRGMRMEDLTEMKGAGARMARWLRKYPDDKIYMDSPYLRFLQRESMRIYRREWNSASTVIAYLVNLFLVIRNMFMIAEGFRFGLSPQEMSVMVVCEG